MNFIFSTFIFLSINSVIFSQSQNDSLKINYYLNKIVENGQKADFKKTQQYIDTARSIITKCSPHFLNQFVELLDFQALVYNGLGNTSKATATYDTCLSILINNKITNSHLYGKINQKKAIVFLKTGNRDSAIYYSEKGYKIIRSLTNGVDKYLEEATSNLGFAYTHFGLYSKSYHMYTEMRDLVNLFYGDTCLLYSKMTLHLAISLYRLSKFEQAALEYEKCLKINTRVFGLLHEEVAIVYNNIGLIYKELQDYDKSLLYLLKAIEIRENIFGPNDLRLANTFNNIGLNYYSMGLYQEAKLYYFRCLNVRKKHLSENNSLIANIHGNIGKVYENLNMLDSASVYHEVQLSILRKSGEQNVNTLAQCYESIAGLNRNKNNYKLAIDFSDSGLAKYNYPKLSIADISINDLFIRLLTHKIENTYLMYSISQDTTWLNKCKTIAGEGRNAIRIYKQESEGISTTLSSINKFIIEIEILVHNNLYLISKNGTHLVDILQLSENSKQLELYERIIHNKAIKFANVPDSIINKEVKLNDNINESIKLLNEKLNISNINNHIDLFPEINTITIARREKDKLIKYIETNYPSYFNLKYSDHNVNFKFIKNNILRKDQCIISFFMNKYTLQSYIISKDTFIVNTYKIDNYNNFTTLIKSFNRLFHQFGSTISYASTFNYSNSYEYCLLADSLYKILIKPIKNYILKEIVFIPDSYLGYIPFEILLPSSPKVVTRFDSHPYLGNDYIISYSPSIRVWLETRLTTSNNKKATVFGVAPFNDINIQYSSKEQELKLRDSFDILPFSGAELILLKSIFKGTYLFGKDATIQSFRKYASKHSILHLSTHASQFEKNGDYSWIAFADSSGANNFEKLYVRDIYSIPIKAELVTLSACETGIGSVIEGEGMITLCRSFIYSGAKSVLTTLWKVDDQSTQELLKLFYVQLTKGVPKSTALWEAKKIFRKKYYGKLQSHPFFWSAFILNGDNAGSLL